MAMSAASVKVERKKLLKLLREAKDEKLAEFDKRMEKFNEEVAKLREKVVKAMGGDPTKDDDLRALYEALSAFYNRKRDQYIYVDDMYVNAKERKNIEGRYDSALKLVEISSDEFFKVTSNTEFGYLLGL